MHILFYWILRDTSKIRSLCYTILELNRVQKTQDRQIIIKNKKLTQLAFTRLKSTLETPEQCAKFVQS